MAKKSGYLRSVAGQAEPLPESPRTFPRWWLLVLFPIATLLIITLLLQGDITGVLFALAQAILVVPVLLVALVAGLALATPLLKKVDLADSAWPDGFRLLVALALGLGTLSLLTFALGSVGLLHGYAPAITLILLAAACYVPARRALAAISTAPLRDRLRPSHLLALVAAIPVAVLFLAASYPLGTLWSSEANGYDALSYHLQLPREYAANNSIAPVTHNIYSFMPANVEMLYLLLMQLARDPLARAIALPQNASHLVVMYAAQFLHAIMMLLAAAALLLAPIKLSATARCIAALAFLATPWVLVTGSLPYNESGMLLFGTLALLLTLSHGRSAALPIGLLLGLAITSKLTAGLYFALPIAAILLCRGQLRPLLIVIAGSLLLYSPWLVRTALHARGNPVFPFAANILGQAHWSDEQVARWQAGHRARPDQQSLSQRLVALGQASLNNDRWSPSIASIRKAFGDDTPAPAWQRAGLLFILFAIAAALALRRTRIAWWLLLVIILQLLAWLTLTHLQSRFLLPILVPLVLLLALAAEHFRAQRTALAITTALFAAVTFLPWLTETRRYPTQPVGLLHELIQPDFLLRMQEVKAPNATRILLIGEARAFYWRDDVSYATAFDHLPIAKALNMSPNEALAFLQQNNYTHVLIVPSEIDRLRRTYNFDPSSLYSPENFAALQAFGLKPIAAQMGAILFEVPRTPSTQPL